MYWMINNRGQAEVNALNMLIGHLNAMVEYEITATPEELLKYIRKKLDEEEKRLDERFPEYAALKKGEDDEQTSIRSQRLVRAAECVREQGLRVDQDYEQ